MRQQWSYRTQMVLGGLAIILLSLAAWYLDHRYFVSDRPVIGKVVVSENLKAPEEEVEPTVRPGLVEEALDQVEEVVENARQEAQNIEAEAKAPVPADKE